MGNVYLAGDQLITPLPTDAADSHTQSRQQNPFPSGKGVAFNRVTPNIWAYCGATLGCNALVPGLLTFALVPQKEFRIPLSRLCRDKNYTALHSIATEN